MRSPNRRRVAWALAASALIHLLMLAAYVRMVDWYRRQELRPTRYLPDLLILAPQLFRQQPVTRLPERLVERVEVAREPVPMPGIGEGPSPPGVPEAPGPAPGLAAAPARGRRPEVFRPLPEPADSTLNQRQLEAVARLRDALDRYARIWLPDVDTTDRESRLRVRAEAVVARAFAAMGGLDNLLEITKMRTIVWIVAFESVLQRGRTVRVDTVAPYPYPIATWYAHGLGQVERQAFRVDFDLTSGKPFPAYVVKNPERTRQAYYRLFDARWLLSAPLTTRRRRLRSEDARWHIVDRFLGEGVRLSYGGSGRLDGYGPSPPLVDRVRVDDRKYGRSFEAYFDRRSGLLLAVREILSAPEAAWFQQKQDRRAPVWMTRYDDYRPVGKVLLPHHWTRSVSTRSRRARSPLQRVELYLNIAVNGAWPDTVAPEL